MLAFAQEVIDKMEIPAIKEYLEGLIVEKYIKRKIDLKEKSKPCRVLSRCEC
jgi:hypothetical protein